MIRLLLLFTILFSSSSAFACTCKKNSNIDLEEVYKNVSIFIGKVSETNLRWREGLSEKEKQTYSPSYQDVKFENIIPIHNIDSNSVKILNNISSSCVNGVMNVGESYLVEVFKNHNNILVRGGCSKTKLISDEAFRLGEDLYEIYSEKSKLQENAK